MEEQKEGCLICATGVNKNMSENWGVFEKIDKE